MTIELVLILSLVVLFLGVGSIAMTLTIKKVINPLKESVRDLSKFKSRRDEISKEKQKLLSHPNWNDYSIREFLDSIDEEKPSVMLKRKSNDPDIYLPGTEFGIMRLRRDRDEALITEPDMKVSVDDALMTEDSSGLTYRSKHRNGRRTDRRGIERSSDISYYPHHVPILPWIMESPPDVTRYSDRTTRYEETPAGGSGRPSGFRDNYDDVTSGSSVGSSSSYDSSSSESSYSSFDNSSSDSGSSSSFDSGSSSSSF